VAQSDVALHPLAAQIQVAVLEAQGFRFACLAVNVEGRRLGLIEDGGLLGDDLDLTSWHVRIFCSGWSLSNGAMYLEYPFAARSISDGESLGCGFLVKRHLDDARSVAQTDKE
jgi:hypothetical protein